MPDAPCAGSVGHGRIIEHCERTADELLRAPRDIAILHGDIHQLRANADVASSGTRPVHVPCPIYVSYSSAASRRRNRSAPSTSTHSNAAAKPNP